MRVAGVHARVKDKRHVVGLAAVDDVSMTCLSYSEWRAPAGETAAGQLSELYVRARELLERAEAEALISWTAEPAKGGKGQRGPLIDASRAEGVVMAAAGAVSSVRIVAKTSGATVRAAAGVEGTGPSTDALCQQLSDLPAGDPVRSAAAGALAWALRN